MSLLKWFLEAISTRMVEHTRLMDDKEARMKINSNNTKNKVIMYSKLNGFQVPLHYPRYRKEDYEMMEEWKLDVLLREYGLACEGSVQDKRSYAIGAFLWPDQL